MKSKRCISIAMFFLSIFVLAGGVVTSQAEDLIVDLGRGPITVTVPTGYEPGSPMPLVLVLHGYGGSHVYIEEWWGMADRAEEYGFFVAHPDGTIDNNGARFWNATDACCNFFGSTVDDSQYLLDLIDEIKSLVDVDDRRVYVTGHSNGGFMSYRMACDHPETVAAIGSMAGATWADPLDCNPASSVHALQIHGTADGVISYNGGNIGGNIYPSAVESVEYWAGVAGCSLLPDTSAPPVDLESSIPGAETTITRYADDCGADGSGELWTLTGAGHSPNFNELFSQMLVEYLLAHPKSDVAAETDVSVDPISNLFSCAPNPFSSTTSIRLQLDTPEEVSVRVLTASGRRIRNLIGSRTFPAGDHTILWDGQSDGGDRMAAGAYFIHVQLGNEHHNTRVVQFAH